MEKIQRQNKLCVMFLFLSFLSLLAFTLFPNESIMSYIQAVMFLITQNTSKSVFNCLLLFESFHFSTLIQWSFQLPLLLSLTHLSLDHKVNVGRSIEVQRFAYDQSFALEEEDQFSTPILQDTRIPYLQMLQQSEEDPSSVLPFKDPNFLQLLSLHTFENYPPHEVPEFRSLIHSEKTNLYCHNPSLEGNNEAITSQELSLNPLENANPRRKHRNNNLATSMTKEKRKRRRTKPTKNIEELENQRMTHIAVERNRRRQMNIHLNSLRSLIPSSYIQRGDQASIVGGAIDFVKILEQHLQSLEAQKITQQSDNKDNNILRNISSNNLRATDEEKTSKHRIDVTVTEYHVNLKIQSPRKQGQLLNSIISLEKLGFTVLHLNVTSPSNALVTYSFNLKIEDDCSLRSADEITTMIRQIFECC